MFSETERIRLRKIFAEICTTKSLYSFKNQDVYVKHFGLSDDLEQGFYFSVYLEDARKHGIFTEKEKLDYLVKNKLWEEKAEKEIEERKTIIKNLYNDKRKAYRFNEIEGFGNQIKTAETELLKVLNKRAILVEETAESVAQKKVDLLIIQSSFFKDKNLTVPLFSPAEFDELNINETEDLFSLYRSIQEDLDDTNVRKISICNFFTNLFYLTEDVYHFYGIAISQLTHNQTRLITWGKYFKSILTENNIPLEFMDDPDKIEEWTTGKRNLDSIIEKHDNDSNSQLSLNISQKELRHYGLDAPVDPNQKLHEKTVAAGGELSFEEAIKAGIIPLLEK